MPIEQNDERISDLFVYRTKIYAAYCTEYSCTFKPTFFFFLSSIILFSSFFLFHFDFEKSSSYNFPSLFSQFFFLYLHLYLLFVFLLSRAAFFSGLHFFFNSFPLFFLLLFCLFHIVAIRNSISFHLLTLFFFITSFFSLFPSWILCLCISLSHCWFLCFIFLFCLPFLSPTI